MTKIDDKIITSISDVKKGNTIVTEISNGKIESVIENIFDK